MGPAALVFEDVRVQHANILGAEARVRLAMRWIGRGRYLLPARAIGACELLVEMALEHARNRVTFGEPIAERQAIQWMVAGVKANEIVDRVLQIHGGMGYTRELPVERWYRELRLLRIYEGTDEIQRWTISRAMLKGHASVRGHLG